MNDATPTIIEIIDQVGWKQVVYLINASAANGNVHVTTVKLELY